MADEDVLGQAVTDALAGAPGSVDQQQIQAPTQLQAPADPGAGINPAVLQEIQARQGQQGPPQPGGKPQLIDYIQNMIKGPQQASPLSAPTSRGDMTLDFMGHFLSNLSAGLAASGHGPGANIRGAAAAMQAPFQQRMQQYQMGQEEQTHQAQIQAEQAKTAQTQAQTAQLANVVQTPYGPMSAQLAAKVFPASINAQGKVDAAKVAATSRTDVADTNAASREKIAATKPAHDNEISLIQKANAGDPDAKAAWDKLQQGRIQVRAASANQKPMTYYDAEQGRNVTLGAGEAEAMQKAGKNLIPAGTVPANTLLQMQKAQSSIPTAIQDMQKSLGAWDNPSDRAIFAKVIKDTPTGGDPSSWFNNVISQAGQENLSPEGQDALVKLRGLNESLGTLRAISGLPSTAGSMMATAALLPGATTGSSKMARAQLDQISKLVERETGVPFLGGGKTTPKVPPATGNYSSGNPFAPKKSN